MKKIVLTTILAFSLKADYYMAQIEPYQTHTVQAEIGGIVSSISLSKEFSYLDKTILVVKLDTTNEDIEIEALSKQKDVLNEALELKRENLKSKSSLRQISKYELNSETLSVLDTKSNLISTERELSLKKSNREKKRFYLTDGYLGQIFVDEFEYVPTGGKLFEYFDFSKNRLDLYIPADEVENIKTKKIFLDGVENGDWRVEKVSEVKDTQKISTYLVRLVSDNRNPKDAKFGKVVKVEFK
jgi:hypothetical protein